MIVLLPREVFHMIILGLYDKEYPTINKQQADEGRLEEDLGEKGIHSIVSRQKELVRGGCPNLTR
jgi:hypothetical protein